MAIERKISKDISNYEPKLLLGFTTRQTICLIPMASIACLVIFGLGNIVPTLEVRLTIAAASVLPFVLIGWVPICKQPFLKFVKSAFVSMLLSPARRKYKRERIEDCALAPVDIKKAVNKTKKHSKDKKVKCYK